nr:peptidase S10, serine carboxypeptidase, alpha/beta hydrolase fold protein [Tanacetum cinerariifolium]
MLPGYPGPLPIKLEIGYICLGNPEDNPLIIWLVGGPGCSNLHAFFFEIGPFKIKKGIFIDGVLALQMDPNSWTKLGNIIYLDGPTLTRYSYTTTDESAYSSDTLSASQTAEFVWKDVGRYMAGNPLTNKSGDVNARFEFAYQMALISKSTKDACNEEYAKADVSNLLCMSGINEVNKHVKDINMSQIIEPNCDANIDLIKAVNPIRMGKKRW